MQKYRIFVINLGSASTKAAYYENESCLVKESIPHAIGETAGFEDIMDQQDFRRKAILNFMRGNGLDAAGMDAVVSRGGQTKPLRSGAFRINQLMLDQIKSGEYGRHPSDLGPGIAYDLCRGVKAIPLVVDPPVSDEFTPVAKLSGHPLMPRQVKFHALSHKATARKHARSVSRNYQDMNLITIHMGGGITLAAHEKGRMVDGTNGIEGEGPYCTNRSGGLTAQFVADLCFSGQYTKKEISEMINGKGGLVGYLGESDVLAVQKAGETDPYAKLCLEGMLYQTCKEAGALAAVLRGKVDAVLITGGIANGVALTAYMRERLAFIADVFVYPGENEMEALALGALDALRGGSPLLEMTDGDGHGLPQTGGLGGL
jgi:butyrate kinase